jgi:multiple sugar transport system ATP-binding protein
MIHAYTASANPRATIALEGVCKVYENGVRALRDCNLTVAAGEWLALVGRSGCGKSTTLRLIAGLTEPTSGTIRIGGARANQMPPAQRDVAMVFQRPALFPGKTVRDNLAFGLRLRQGYLGRLSAAYKDREEQTVREVARCLGIEPLLGRRPEELSGGEQQRVALGRALARRSAIGLLDEPLGHLDASLRQELRRELPLLRSRFPATIVIVTHDPAEALALGDRIAVLQEGRVVQVDFPEKIRQEPCNEFVANLFRSC